jgi:large subunit ribosomal protein L29
MKKTEIKNMTYAELVQKHNELSKKYMDLRFQLVIGHVDNPLQKRIMRREIATLNTLIRQKEIAGQGTK